jgi:hypothetical protein
MMREHTPRMREHTRTRTHIHTHACLRKGVRMTHRCVCVCKEAVVLAAVLCCCGAVAAAAGTAPRWRALLRAALWARARFQKVCYISGARVTPNPTLNPKP